ncbi:ABC-type transport auxiliary lipoprotein family protein [Thioalkalivibrio thiocyanodenitrificans]|uniref:ABC-type transport auxiliary lipoprotein family protein n=1 Tax=Thioalkalivibrio thiocyanodenitrificans TaxID=243063 RepID=UPI00036496B7|nr:ABC-type transport auxiliary lipoprotein family protein [Thioalkalivibrio thiocyanodenitrificans]
MTRVQSWFRNMGFVLTVLSMSACSIAVNLQRPVPEKQHFILDVQRTAATAHGPDGSRLVLGPVRVAPEFESRAFVYQVEAQRYESDFYHLWLTSPRDQVSRVVTEWFQESGVFREVVPPALSGAADYRLDLSVTRLYWDLRDPGEPVAHLTVRAHLSAGLRPERDVRLSTRVEAGERAASAAAQDRVTAMSRAFSRALAELEVEVARAVGGQPASGP